MNLTLIKQSGGSYDITDVVTRVEWSGSASSACRQLSVDVINAPFDGFSIPQICTGDLISFSPEGEEVFYGQFFGSERSSAVGTITYTAYDMMKNMLESQGQYNFKNMTPEAIAQQVCGEAQVPIRWLQPTGINIASMLCDQMSLYDIIMAAYTKAYRINGLKYFPMIYKRGFAVYQSQWIVSGFTISDDENMTEASIRESMDSVVNKVNIYDDKGNKIGEATDPESIGVYGTFQQIYRQEEGVDPMIAANGMLSVTPSQTISISAIGDVNCLSCYYVRITDSATGLHGKYWISSDRHTWENNTHMMELEVNYDSLMGEVEASEEGSAM